MHYSNCIGWRCMSSTMCCLFEKARKLKVGDLSAASVVRTNGVEVLKATCVSGPWKKANTCGRWAAVCSIKSTEWERKCNEMEGEAIAVLDTQHAARRKGRLGRGPSCQLWHHKAPAPHINDKPIICASLFCTRIWTDVCQQQQQPHYSMRPEQIIVLCKPPVNFYTIC